MRLLWTGVADDDDWELRAGGVKSVAQTIASLLRREDHLTQNTS
jgi:hypothetical protein